MNDIYASNSFDQAYAARLLLKVILSVLHPIKSSINVLVSGFVSRDHIHVYDRVSMTKRDKERKERKNNRDYFIIFLLQWHQFLTQSFIDRPAVDWKTSVRKKIRLICWQLTCRKRRKELMWILQCRRLYTRKHDLLSLNCKTEKEKEKVVEKQQEDEINICTFAFDSLPLLPWNRFRDEAWKMHDCHLKIGT